MPATFECQSNATNGRLSTDELARICRKRLTAVPQFALYVRAKVPRASLKIRSRHATCWKLKFEVRLRDFGHRGARQENANDKLVQCQR